MRRRWYVYAIDDHLDAYLWARTFTRRGAIRAAEAFTLMPIYLLPMTPVIVHRDDHDEFAATYPIGADA